MIIGFEGGTAERIMDTRGTRIGTDKHHRQSGTDMDTPRRGVHCPDVLSMSCSGVTMEIFYTGG